MMVFMMKGMHGGHGNHSMHSDHGRKFNSREDEMADLRDKIENLQAQYDELEKDINARNNYHLDRHQKHVHKT